MIPLCIPEISGNELKYVKECIDTGWVSSAGKYTKEFEDRFCEYTKAEKAVVTVNGTSALHLAMACLDIGEGDEVIVPSLTFVATVNTVMYTGASLVFADVCRDTFVMDAEKVEELITRRTKAILPVHLYGHPVEMDKLMDIAGRHGIYVIEDATESLGSYYKDKHTGTIGHIGCFSFNGNKLITTGGGGMLVTNDEIVGDRAKFLSTQAKNVTDNGGYYHCDVGLNYRMPNILAAMGIAQLERIDEFTQKKRSNASYYMHLLKDTKGITLPCEKEWAKNVHWLFSLVVEDEYGIDRDELIKKLKDEGIESRPFFIPLHTMPPYKDYRQGNLEVTMDLAKRGINLPSSVGISKSEIEKVVSVIKSI